MLFVAGLPVIAPTARWRRALGAQALALAAFLPWAVFTARQYRGLGGVFWVPTPTLYSLVETAYEYVRSMLLQEVFLLLAVLGCLQLTAGPARAFALRHARQWLEEKHWTVRLAELEATWLLCCWLFVPIGMLFLVSRIGPSVYVVRATIVAASAFYLMAARGLMQLKGAARLAGAGCDRRAADRRTRRLLSRGDEGAMEPHGRGRIRPRRARRSLHFSRSVPPGRLRLLLQSAPMSDASASRHVDWRRRT